MVERGFKFVWYSHAALNVADSDEVLEAFAQSGCRLLFLGIEAEDRKVLLSMKKNVNLQRDYREVFDRIHAHGIGIHGSVIFGTDEDTIEMLRRRFQFLTQSGIDVLQFCTLTPYPGTRLFKRLRDEGRLLRTDYPADWDRYDLTEILFKPRNLDVDEYRELMKTMGERIYSHSSVARRFLDSWRETRKLSTAIWCLFTNEIYGVPPRAEVESGGKFWYLSNRMWPLINLYQRIERRF
jgi:radical SAM superfamily enzyme YgiQ (UPF0313 family)